MQITKSDYMMFLQHKYDGHTNSGYVVSARMFRNGSNIAHSIAYDLILDNNVYYNKADAEEAESKLGLALTEKGCNAHWA